MIKCTQLHKIDPQLIKLTEKAMELLEHHIDITALGRKDRNTRGGDTTWDLPGREPITPPLLLGSGPTEQPH